jgi:hypothetical protein
MTAGWRGHRTVLAALGPRCNTPDIKISYPSSTDASGDAPALS